MAATYSSAALIQLCLPVNSRTIVCSDTLPLVKSALHHFLGKGRLQSKNCCLPGDVYFTSEFWQSYVDETISACLKKAGIPETREAAPMCQFNKLFFGRALLKRCQRTSMKTHRRVTKCLLTTSHVSPPVQS